MNIEDTKCIDIIGDAQKVNKLIKLGWTLLNTYVITDDGYSTPSFILAWQKEDEPKFLPQRDSEKELE